MTSKFVTETTASGLIVLRRLHEPQPPQPAVFFDRDGVLNVERGYVGKLDDFEWRAGAVEAVRLTKEAGFWAVVVTNQSGIGRGYYSAESVISLSEWMMEQAPFDGILACPHAPWEGCRCRKPSPYMLEFAAGLFEIDRARSFLLGDMARDIEAGEAFGIQSYLVDDGPLDDFIRPLLNSAGTS